MGCCFCLGDRSTFRIGPLKFIYGNHSNREPRLNQGGKTRQKFNFQTFFGSNTRTQISGQKCRANERIHSTAIAAMVVENDLPMLLDALTQSITSAVAAIPEKSFEPPENGITLLDVKNDLLLTYLQNLVFLVILKLRDFNIETETQVEEADILENGIVSKLVELRVFLERGVRPLEGRLSYQIDKVLRAADDAIRSSASKTRALVANWTPIDNNASNDESDRDDYTSKHNNVSEMNDLQYRPNPSSLLKPAPSKSDAIATGQSDGVYRPPRISAMTMPSTSPSNKSIRKTLKSATLDEFVNTELSSQPFAEPSVGSTIISGGRRSMSEHQRKEEAARREYEEKNYMRLPKKSKKERAKQGGRLDAGYGGEEWRGLGEGIDRIERLTKRKNGDGKSVLEKSRKRSAEDGLRQSSAGTSDVGHGFHKRLKTLDRKRKDRS